MNQNTLSIILDLVNRYGAQLVISVINDIRTPSVTDQDWQNLISQIQTPFETYQQIAAKASGGTVAS